MPHNPQQFKPYRSEYWHHINAKLPPPSPQYQQLSRCRPASTVEDGYQRFIIRPATTDDVVSLLAHSKGAAFQRFLFARLFHSDWLLSTGGPCRLLQLLQRQWVREREIENEFYREYKDYRERLYRTLVATNPSFPGTRGKLVRLAQKLIDRCLFVLFCEDMGEVLKFSTKCVARLSCQYRTNLILRRQQQGCVEQAQGTFSGDERRGEIPLPPLEPLQRWSICRRP